MHNPRMRQKEIRIALICYGGVSLAVYMHGVTKEVWHLAKASSGFHKGESQIGGVRRVYCELLEYIQNEHLLRLRFLPDILSGASAGGINAVFLSQAIYSGHSLEPLTDLWLENADVSRLTDPEAEPMWRYAKIWAQPIAEWVLGRPGNAVSESVAPETRAEVRHKVSRLVRGRWFSPPFSGPNFTALLHDALKAMRDGQAGQPLLPPGHPIDLFVTTTDFRGRTELLRLNSPEIVEESEHRMPISFRNNVPANGGSDIANLLELTMAARATASFPGAFPPLQLEEIDELAKSEGQNWDGRSQFLERIMPSHVRDQTTANVCLIDGSVLVNAPFGGAIEALEGRPAQREVDRRFVYIDPRPNSYIAPTDDEAKPVGFFASIFGSLSTIPREQPIRDNLEELEQQSHEAARLSRILAGLRPEIERAVEKLFGMTFLMDRPTAKRLKNWRNKAQQAAAEDAGYAFHSYAQAKFNGIVERLAAIVHDACPQLGLPDGGPIEDALRQELQRRGITDLSAPSGGASEPAIAFFRAHDIGFRIRRLRLLARRLARDWEQDTDIPDDALDTARAMVYDILGLYLGSDGRQGLGVEFDQLSSNVLNEPGAVLDYLGSKRLLPEVDDRAEELFASGLEKMPKQLRRRMMLTYLGFPFYDVATLPLLRNEGLTEFDPVKVDRISPDDARSIRSGGTEATLRGTEFFSFGAFFSRAYRENDYLWGRLHGAERMIDLICSTVESGVDHHICMQFKHAAFLAIIDEEVEVGRCNSKLLDELRSEIEERLS